MNTALFFARRLFSDKRTSKGISRPIVTIATTGISLGLAVMIISVFIVTGFKKEIRNKIVGFSSHIKIENYKNNISYLTKPIDRNQDFLPRLRNEEGIAHVQAFATIPGIITTNEQIQGVVLKGVNENYNWRFFKKHLKAGHTFTISDTTTTDKALISRELANLLKLDTGHAFRMYFIQQPPRMRKFNVEGIYETSMEEFDKLFVIVDIKHVQRLNNWDTNQVSGFEISLDDYSEIDEMTGRVDEIAGYQFSEEGDLLKTSNIKDIYVQIFDWLNLQDMNVWIILTLMVVVAGFNMVSGLLILILERTNMIGILKALGAENILIRRIFLYHSGFLISKGLFWGNVIGVGLCLVQLIFGVIKLDPTSYYLEEVPIHFDFMNLLLLNIGTLFITLFMLVFPSVLISRISPEKTIRYE